MLLFLWTASTGWIAVSMLAIAATLPFALRLFRIAGASRAMAFRWHYLLGFGIPALSLIHAWAPMSKGGIGAFNETGIWIASAALLFLFVQMALGLELREARTRLLVRRSHLAMMIVSVALIAAHVALNRV